MLPTPEHTLPRICVFTGTRAEFGLLRPIARGLRLAGADLQLLVTGSHLGHARASSLGEIEEDNFPVVELVEVNLESGSRDAICTALGLGVMRYGDVLRRLKPDCVVILGDRFEAFAMATAATIWQVPIAHLHGGELTIGAIDDEFRHAITKMSYLHFTSTEIYRQRVIQLGENPDRVFNVGALGVENALSLPLLPRPQIEARLGLRSEQAYFLATFHPVTRGNSSSDEQLAALFAAIEHFPDIVTVFTSANADAGGASVNRMLEEYASRNSERMRLVGTLGQIGYLSAIKHADAVLGNSSSGVIEVPSFGIPSVDIGSRQQGRVRSESVIACEPTTDAIVAALQIALSDSFRAKAMKASNPYQGESTADVILDRLMRTNFRHLPSKIFFDLLPG